MFVLTARHARHGREIVATFLVLRGFYTERQENQKGKTVSTERLYFAIGDESCLTEATSAGCSWG
jgi:hypothetical protein